MFIFDPALRQTLTEKLFLKNLDFF